MTNPEARFEKACVLDNPAPRKKTNFLTKFRHGSLLSSRVSLKVSFWETVVNTKSRALCGPIRFDSSLDILRVFFLVSHAWLRSFLRYHNVTEHRQ